MNNRKHIETKIWVLTTNMLGVPELLVHQRVHADVHLLLLSHEEVAINHLLLDPVLERLPDHRRADVDDPLFWGLI